MNWMKILTVLSDEGLSAYGFARVEAFLPPRYAHLPYAVSLVFRLSSAVVDDIVSTVPPKPTYAYFHHYRTVNTHLDHASLLVAAHLERDGFRALPVAASQTVHDQGLLHHGLFPHKTAAALAGLGWIGKSALFVSHRFGPRVRLSTVLTDCPLPEARAETPVSLCGTCAKCVTACPAQAITGRPFSPGQSRSAQFDAQACNDYMRGHFMEIGRGAVCGICLSVCPYGEKAVSSLQNNLPVME